LTPLPLLEQIHKLGAVPQSLSGLTENQVRRLVAEKYIQRQTTRFGVALLLGPRGRADLGLAKTHYVTRPASVVNAHFTHLALAVLEQKGYTSVERDKGFLYTLATPDQQVAKCVIKFPQHHARALKSLYQDELFYLLQHDAILIVAAYKPSFLKTFAEKHSRVRLESLEALWDC
jgi:hypothetical protein